MKGRSGPRDVAHHLADGLHAPLAAQIVDGGVAVFDHVQDGVSVHHHMEVGSVSSGPESRYFSDVRSARGPKAAPFMPLPVSRGVPMMATLPAFRCSGLRATAVRRGRGSERHPTAHGRLMCMGPDSRFGPFEVSRSFFQSWSVWSFSFSPRSSSPRSPGLGLRESERDRESKEQRRRPGGVSHQSQHPNRLAADPTSYIGRARREGHGHSRSNGQKNLYHGALQGGSAERSR